MIIPCEIAVKSVIPAIKAALAKQLINEYNLKQSQVAELLGISQSAVSKYTRQVRGYTIKTEDIEEIQPLINEMINILIKKRGRRMELLQIFCQTCMTIRKMGLMCDFCRKTEPKLTAEECKFCRFQNCLYSKITFESNKAHLER